jgi:hypothetical protein
MITLLHGDINKLERAILKVYQKKTDYTWGLLGEDCKAFDKLHQCFGYINRDTEIGPLFQKISWELREPVLQFMGKLSKHNHSIEWWSTGLASKSIFQQDLFLRVCFIKLLEEMEKKGKNVIFYIADADFFFLSKDLFAGRFRFITDTSYLICRIKRCFRLSLQKYNRFMKLFLDKLLTVRMFDEFFGMETLVFSWIVGNSFNKSCDYKDLWGGSFYEEFSKYSECERLVFPYVSLRALIKSFLSKTSFIYTASYCSWLEFFNILFKKVTLNNNYEYTFQGINLKALVDDEIRKENVAGLIYQYLIFYKGLCHIFKKSAKLKMIFHLFEGQPQEKIIKLAIMESKKDIKTFGFQHSAFSELHLSNFCSTEEYRLNTMPDYVLANSHYHRNKLGKDGFPKERISTIGDLRCFGHIVSNEEKPKPSRSNVRKIRTILVCLTVRKEESLMALYDCCHAFINLKKKGYQFKVYIKPHPLVDINVNVIPLIKELNGCLEFFDGDIKSILDKSDLLIYLHGAVGCEAMQQGKTVLQKMSDLSIDLDPLNPDEKKLLLYSCFFHEIEDRLEMLLSGNISEKKQEGDRAQSPSFFDKIQYRNFEKIADLAGIG